MGANILQFDYELVGKIGSMALIRREEQDLDYNIFSRIGAQLKPGMIWVTSGATEIGRVDYWKRNGCELEGNIEDVKTDYSAQGQSILMANYRQFISPAYSVRQVLVEHQHFNNPEKREHIRRLLLRAAEQKAIPIVNYNDPVSTEENRKMELYRLKEAGESDVVECVDNDETASVISQLVHSRVLLILSTVEGIYRDPKDPSTLIREIAGKDPDDLQQHVHEVQKSCVGASRAGANGAKAKLEFVIRPACMGTTVIIGHARHGIRDLLEGNVPCTKVCIR